MRAYATIVWGLKLLVYGALMYYFDGEQCANGIARDFRIQVPFTILALSERARHREEKNRKRERERVRARERARE